MSQSRSFRPPEAPPSQTRPSQKGLFRYLTIQVLQGLVALLENLIKQLKSESNHSKAGLSKLFQRWRVNPVLIGIVATVLIIVFSIAPRWFQEKLTSPEVTPQTIIAEKVASQEEVIPESPQILIEELGNNQPNVLELKSSQSDPPEVEFHTPQLIPEQSLQNTPEEDQNSLETQSDTEDKRLSVAPPISEIISPKDTPLAIQTLESNALEQATSPAQTSEETPENVDNSLETEVALAIPFDDSNADALEVDALGVDALEVADLTIQTIPTQLLAAAPPIPLEFAELSPDPLSLEHRLLQTFQQQVSQQLKISDAQNPEGQLIQSIQTDFFDSVLWIKLSAQWYRLTTRKQDKLTTILWGQARQSDFSKLMIINPSDKLIARSSIIGSDMIILERQLLEDTN
ncbi:MAG: hypothetical protein ACFBSC_08440 [Microcoleaceae cyanobacterium]